MGYEMKFPGAQIFVLAAFRSDESLPKESKILGDKIYFDVKSAAEDINTLPKYMNNKVGIFKGILTIEAPVLCPICGASPEEDCDAGLHS